MAREQLALDGTWDFHLDHDASLTFEKVVTLKDWRTACVPSPWQAQFDDLRETAGTAWYRRVFVIPAAWQGQAAFLHFGAVNYYTEVWLNDHYIGAHEGGYLPFEFELGAHLRVGESNELVVRVTVPSDNPDRFPDFPFGEIPHGKQSWYGVLGGIWQSVWLETRAPEYITHIELHPDLNSGVIRAHIGLASTTYDQSRALRVWVSAPNGTIVHERETAIPPETAHIEIVANVSDPVPWSPDDPHLYRFHVALAVGGAIVDERAEAFGFRTIEARDGKLYLNGALLYLRGALDQDYYPDTICTPPSEDFLEDQFRKAKALGLNCLRCHIKIPDPRYLAVADRVGMLIWLDIPNTARLTPAARERLTHTLHQTIERDYNHPSIIIWTIINEDWGTDLVHNADHRAWLHDMYQWLKERDPSRLVIDNSACWPNFHIQTDIEDYHFYRAMPDHRREWDNIIDQFAHRANWTFSPHGDALRTGNEPLIVSEFGNWGLPDTNLLADDNGDDPWWFETGMDWGDGIAYPHGIEHRFKAWHLDRVFGDWESFIAATQWQQYQALKYEIESMRRHEQIAGYVITELTDVHWEANGLLDMARNPRVFYDALAALNADTVVIPGWDRVAYWAGEEVCIKLQVAHSSSEAVENASIKWQLEGYDIGGVIPVSRLAPGTVSAVDGVKFYAPPVATGQHIDLVFTLVATQDAVVATNRLTLTLIPSRNHAALPERTLWTPDTELHDYCSALGYKMTSTLDTADLALTRRLTDELTGYVRKGGRLVLLADQPDSIPVYAPGQQVIEPYFPYTQQLARKGTFWAGDWVSAFAWLRRRNAFRQLPDAPLTDFAFENVAPEYVLSGFGQQDFEAHVHAGMFLGWVHKNVALLAERHYGQGKAIVTTFRLLGQEPGVDPVATVILDAMIASV